jgi:hypothetical protein
LIGLGGRSELRVLVIVGHDMRLGRTKRRWLTRTETIIVTTVYVATVAYFVVRHDAPIATRIPIGLLYGVEATLLIGFSVWVACGTFGLLSHIGRVLYYRATGWTPDTPEKRIRSFRGAAPTRFDPGLIGDGMVCLFFFVVIVGTVILKLK